MFGDKTLKIERHYFSYYFEILEATFVNERNKNLICISSE